MLKLKRQYSGYLMKRTDSLKKKKKKPDPGKDCGQEEKGITEDETVRWHHQINGHELEQTLGDGEG